MTRSSEIRRGDVTTRATRVETRLDRYGVDVWHVPDKPGLLHLSLEEAEHIADLLDAAQERDHE